MAVKSYGFFLSYYFIIVKVISITEIETNIKFIYQWTKFDLSLYSELTGFLPFRQRNCPKNLCFITDREDLLGNLSEFDIILLEGSKFIPHRNMSLPSVRSVDQNFVFYSLESADYYPVCSDRRLNGYFNLTLSYKLSSDYFISYVWVRDRNFNIIGPRKDMNWLRLENMQEINDDFKLKLKSKSKVAAWIVSSCDDISKRFKFVWKLQKELKVYNLRVDVYGICGGFEIAKENMDLYMKYFRKDYYFYLSFEEALSEDYVTGQLLVALKNIMVPVVYGGANYTRFMPEGMYLNARSLGPKKLAALMRFYMNNTVQYYNFFRWKNHYSYHAPEESSETDNYCRLCSLAHNESLMKRTTVRTDFMEWWNDNNFDCKKIMNKSSGCDIPKTITRPCSEKWIGYSNVGQIYQSAYLAGIQFEVSENGQENQD